MPKTGGEATRLPRGRICEMTPPASSRPRRTRLDHRPTRRQRALRAARSTSASQRRGQGSAGPAASEAEGRGGPRRPLSPRGEENVGRPDSNPRPQHRLTLPGPARDSSSATTPETGLGYSPPLASQTSGCSGRFGGSADSVVPSRPPIRGAGEGAGPGSLGTDRARSGRGGIR